MSAIADWFRRLWNGVEPRTNEATTTIAKDVLAEAQQIASLALADFHSLLDELDEATTKFRQVKQESAAKITAAETYAEQQIAQIRSDLEAARAHHAARSAEADAGQAQSEGVAEKVRALLA